ncbi:MAG: XcyI family restriction endonuclease [Burkholderiales bacterium]|nr:XcyI family restriction endonuclease [Burkholderiales bacterium]
MHWSRSAQHGRRESPSSNRFYRLSQVDGKSGDEYVDFRNRVISMTDVPSP